MPLFPGRVRALLAACCLTIPALGAHAQTAVYQRGYDAGVSGALLSETRLTPANVAAASFGRLFSLPVDGRIYAQPLYVPGLTIAGKGVHNVLFVATMNNKLYAFDADASGAPLWSVDFSARYPGTTAVPIADYVGTDSLNIAGPVGIESTPVIDPASGTMYLVTNTRELGAPVFRLHAIDITSGAEKGSGPTVISGSVSAGGKTISFAPGLQNQRAALVLAHGQVVVAFASHEDYYAYYGWVMSYDAATLAQTGILNTAPTDDHGGGIWQSGRPPVVDANGYVYLFVGNAWAAAGSSSAWDGISNFSETVLKLDPTQGLKIVDYFTPANHQALDNADADLTSSGPLLMPGTNVLAGGGKSGIVFLLNTQNLGQMHAGDTGALQSAAVSAGEIRGGPVAWARSAAAGGPLLFNWGANDTLKAFAFGGSSLNTTPLAQASGVSTLYPGGELALSANGDTQGIVWAAINGQGDADHRVPPGELHAFNAANVAQELWNSTRNAARDDIGLLAKWVPPVVANGRVYMASSSGQVLVYGQLPAGNLLTVWPPHQPVLGGTASFIVNTMTAASGLSVAASYAVAGLPTGAAAGFATDSMGRTVMTVTTAATTPRGSYRLQVTATAGASQVTQAVLLDVPDTTAAAASAAAADSAQSGNPASAAIDGNSGTIWHTQYTGSTPGYPHQITLDLGSAQLVSGLSYLPRQDNCVNGTLLKYEVHLSTDNVNWVEETTGGSFDYGPQWRTYTCSGGKASPQRQSISFSPTTARYVRLTGLSALVDGQPWTSAAEVKAYVAKGAVPLAGNYVLAARHSGQVMAVSGGSTAAGAPVVQLPYGAAASQQWSFAAASAGWYHLAALNSGLALDVNGGSTAAGTTLVQSGWTGANWQQFNFTPVGDGRGFVTIGNRNAAGTCLDISGASTASGAGLIQWPCNNGANQQWMLSPVSTTAP